jgi:4'-phosphopantetheinyl transferase
VESVVPALADEDVHVWWLSLDGAATSAEHSMHLLSEAERDRALRFRFEKHRIRFVAGRAGLRTILGRYTGIEASRVRVEASSSGKPFLADRPDVQFNVSHSDDRAVLAVARRAVGVDLEKMREIEDAPNLAARWFGPSEIRALLAFPVATQSEAFLRCWTRKEAFVKGKGAGLRMPLTSFEVSVGCGAPMLAVAQGSGDASWRLHELDAGPGWVGALAIERESAKIVQMPPGSLLT